MQDLRHFFAPIHFLETQPADAYEPAMWGAHVSYPTDKGFDWEDADIIIIGCGEMRGDDESNEYSQSPDAVRKQFYEMYNWHPSIKIADAGNILEGATLGDTRAALRTVLSELREAGKTVVVLGGSHDLTLQQYEAFKKEGTIINAAVVDMKIDLQDEELVTSRSFLMDILTGQPNFIRHYSHIGFQSYYVHPHMLETLDKLRFDFFRLGKVKEHIEEMEPVLRAANLLSFDINAIRFSNAFSNMEGSPNGFDGEEACNLLRYAGMSKEMTSVGIYGYDARKDYKQMTAKQLAQMLWYFIDGYLLRRNEAKLSEENEFVRFHVSFTGNDILFIKSKRTNRWWMQMPNEEFVPCSYTDYQTASNSEIPERWLREQERLV